MGKTIEGVTVDKLKLVKQINYKLYNTLIDVLSKNYIKPIKSKTYIANLYKGELDDATTQSKIDLDWDEVNDISIYKTNKNGKIVLFSFTKDNQNHMFIGVDDRGENFFRDNYGVNLGALLTRSNNLLLPMTPNTSTSYTDKLSPDVLPSNDGKDEVGFLDIDVSMFDLLRDQWGDGKKGERTAASISYKWNNVFRREKWSNNWGDGYKYILRDKLGSIYLLEKGDMGLVIFDNKKVYDRVKRLGMLDLWINTSNGPRSIKDDDIYWKQDINVENIPE
jgi:hypothetical protein